MSLSIPEFSFGAPLRNRQVQLENPQMQLASQKAIPKVIFKPITCDERYVSSGKPRRNSPWFARYMGKKFL